MNLTKDTAVLMTRLPADADQGKSMTQSYEEIICIEAELSGYRRGSVYVRVDLEKSMVIWKDSHQWNNNFLRSLSAMKRMHFCSMLPTTHILQWKIPNGSTPSEQGVTCHRTDWTVSIFFRDGSNQRLAGCDRFPPEWYLFRGLIESLTMIPFRLR